MKVLGVSREGLDQPLVRITIGAWLLMAVVLSILVGARSPERQSVYPGFVKAARAWTQGKDLYQPMGQGYRYAPIVAPSLAPLSVLPDRLGGVIWRWINGIVLVGGLAATCRRGIPRRWTAPVCAVLFLLVLPDAIANLNNGQPNAMVAGLMLLSVAMVVGQRWTLSALCLAVATLLKLYPVALAGVLILLYPRKLAWRYALFLGIGLLLPFALQRFAYVKQQYHLWYIYIWQENRQLVPISHWYRDIRLPMKVWFGLEIGNSAYRAIEAAAGAAIGAACWLLQRRGLEQRRLLALAVGWTAWWMTLLGPATETVTYLILIPAMAWALIETWDHANAAKNRREAGRGFRRALVTAAYLLLMTVHVSGWFGGRAYLTLGPSPLAAILFGAYLLVVTAGLFTGASGPIPPASERPTR